MKTSLTIAGLSLIAAAVCLVNVIAGLAVLGVECLIFVELLDGATWAALWAGARRHARRIPRPRRRPPVLRTALAQALAKAAEEAPGAAERQ